MEDAEGYEILTGDKISRLRQEVDRFKGTEKQGNSQDLTQAVKELNESIKKLYQLFADVQEEIVKEYTSGESPDKKIDKIMDQNKHIAEAVLVLSEKMSGIDDEKEEEKNKSKMPEKPVFEEQPKPIPEVEKKSWLPFSKPKPIQEQTQPQQNLWTQQQVPQQQSQLPQQTQQPQQNVPFQAERQPIQQQPAFKEEDFKFPGQDYQQPQQPRYPQQQPQQPQFQTQQQWNPPQQSLQFREEERWGDDNDIPPPPAQEMSGQQDYFPPNISRSRPMPEPIMRNQPQYGYRQPMQMQRQGYVNPNFPTQDNFQGLRGVTPSLDRPIHAEADLERRRGLLGVFKK